MILRFARNKGSLILVIMLVIGLFSLLTSCGPNRLSEQAYQNLVINALKWEGQIAKKSELSLPGLIPSIDKVFDAMYCPEAACVQPEEMSYLSKVAETERYATVEYRAKICKKQVHPPSQMESAHQKICKLLKDISLQIDSVKMSATQASISLSQGGGKETKKGLAKSFSQRILEEKGKILDSLQKLATIKWLAPLFEGIKNKIPEFEKPGRGT